MIQTWQKSAARFDALQPRERWLIAAALLGGVVLLGASLFIEPALKRAQQAERSLAEQRAQLANMQAQVAILQSPQRDPDMAARAELDALKRQLQEQAVRMQTVENSLVPPQRMAALLDEMIGQRSGLRLLSLKTLPPVPFAERAKEGTGDVGKGQDKTIGLYKHGVEIRLEGSYQELTAYLECLEKARSKLLWSSVSLSAAKHPRLVLTLLFIP